MPVPVMQAKCQSRTPDWLQQDGNVSLFQSKCSNTAVQKHPHAHTSCNHADLRVHIRLDDLLGKAALDLDHVACLQCSNVLGDVSGWVRFDDEVKVTLCVIAGGRRVRLGAGWTLDHQQASGGHAELGIRGRQLDPEQVGVVRQGFDICDLERLHGG